MREFDMIRLGVALITALGLSLLTAVAADANPTGKKIAFLVTSPTHPFIATLSKTFVSRANSFGMEVNTVSQHFDAALQAQQVDDAIATVAFVSAPSGMFGLDAEARDDVTGAASAQRIFLLRSSMSRMPASFRT